MGAIRNLIRRYPAAAVAIVLAAAVFGGWMIYQQRQAEQPGVDALPGRPVTLTSPSGAAAPGPAPGSPAGAGATTVTPTSPSGATPPQSTRTGRANPFEPLAGPSNPGTTPAGGSTIPPVPPVPPSVAPGAAAPPGPAAPSVPVYKVVGFLWSDRALAILEDGGGSYIVAPGDTVRPGVQVLAVDVRHELVRLDQEGTPAELTFAPIRRSP